MQHDLGPQSSRIYRLLRESIVRGEYPPGTALPSYNKLAAQYGASAVIVRQVLALLEDEGLVSRQQGRGTFVQSPTTAGVLIVEDDEEMRTLLGTYVERAGYRAVVATGPVEGLAALKADGAIGLILSDVRMPDRASGTAFIRTVHRRWPAVPVVAITGYPDDLAELHGSPECPMLILAKPVREPQLVEIFRWTMASDLRRNKASRSLQVGLQYRPS